MNDPEVGGLLRDAVDPNKGFSPTTFQAKLAQTSWYKTKSQAQRQYTIQRHTDPGSFKHAIRDYTTQIRHLSYQMGVRLTANEVRYIAHSAYSRGLAPDSLQVTRGIGAMARKNPGRLTKGAIRTAQNQINQMAKNDYFFNPSGNTTRSMAISTATGSKSMDDARKWAQDQAISRHPHLRGALLDGRTMSEIFSGHVNTISEELELSPAQVQSSLWRSSKWTPVMGVHDPKMKTTRPLTVSETRTLARKDPRFWQTSNGKQMDAGMTNFLLQTFGEVKS